MEPWTKKTRSEKKTVLLRLRLLLRPALQRRFISLRMNGRDRWERTHPDSASLRFFFLLPSEKFPRFDSYKSLGSSEKIHSTTAKKKDVKCPKSSLNGFWRGRGCMLILPVRANWKMFLGRGSDTTFGRWFNRGGKLKICRQEPQKRCVPEGRKYREMRLVLGWKWRYICVIVFTANRGRKWLKRNWN